MPEILPGLVQFLESQKRVAQLCLVLGCTYLEDGKNIWAKKFGNSVQ